MAATALTDRYAANLHGVLSCYDRITITGTLPGACHAGGMTSFLYSLGIRIFDYARFAEPLRERIRQRAQEVYSAAGVEIEHVSKSHIRKEDLVARVLAARGDAPGLVHVISAMEGCPSYTPWLDKSNGHVFLRPAQGKCLHYYFYFIDEEFGLCYLRVPTWAPFGLQFYCNGHSALARSLRREGIEFLQEDNAFLRKADLARAQALADAFNPEQLHRRLTRYAHWLCPVADVFAQDDWHWSIRQAEYSTDLMFRTREILTPLYDAISRQAVLAADAPRVAAFLGKKVTPQLAQRVGSRLSTRFEGRCNKHYMGAAGVKVYDKFSRVLRVETTVNDVSFFKHHRKVEHKGEAATRELAPLKKSIYSLIDLREILLGCNQRYLASLSSLDDPSAGATFADTDTLAAFAAERALRTLPRPLAVLCLGLLLKPLHGAASGLGLLPLSTQFNQRKSLRTGAMRFAATAGCWAALAGVAWQGYEIHHGRSLPVSTPALPGAVLRNDAGESIGWQLGSVLGLYAHGLFESAAVLQALFGAKTPTLDSVFDGLADFVDRHFEPGSLAQLIGG